MVVVVDASAAGGPQLQPGLSGVGDLVLSAPPGARSALVADTAPPAVVAPLAVGPSGTLRGLTTVRPGGARQTVAALDLALQQLPPGPDDPRLVVLYTAAPDAGGPGRRPRRPADRGGRRPGRGRHRTRRGAAVLGHGRRGDRRHGGRRPLAGSSRRSTQLAAALRTRYLVTFPAPEVLPVAAVVHADTPQGRSRRTPSCPRRPPRRGRPGPGAAGPSSASVGRCGWCCWRCWLVGRAPGRPARDPGTAPGGPARRRAWNVPSRDEHAAPRDRLLAAMHAAVRDGAARGAASRRRGDGPGHDDRDDRVRAPVARRVRHRLVGPGGGPAAGRRPAGGAGRDPRPGGADRHAPRRRRIGCSPRCGAGTAGCWSSTTPGARGSWPGSCPAGPATCWSPPTTRSGTGTPRRSPVGRFDRDESVGLLRSRRPELSPAEADRVAAALDDVPQAVDVAGATLAETGMSVGTYLRDAHRARTGRRGRGRDGVRGRPRPARHRRPARVGPAGDAGLAGPRPGPAVPARRLRAPDGRRRRGSPSWPRSCSGAGWPGSTASAVQLHPTPAAVLVAARRDTAAGRPPPSGSCGPRRPPTRTPRRGGRCCRTSWPPPTPPAGSTTSSSRWVGCSSSAGAYLRARGEPRAARALFEDAHDLYRRRLGPDHPDTLAAARTLADDLEALGDHEHARRVRQDAGVGGPRNPEAG